MEVEWLILADAAQVVGGKLYLLGGGWNRYTVNTGFPSQQTMAVAMSVTVPWAETNERRAFAIEVLTEDGESLGKVGGAFEVGRPPGVPAGSALRTQMAVTIQWRVNKPGTYEIVGSVDGAGERHFPFFVVAGAGVTV